MTPQTLVCAAAPVVSQSIRAAGKEAAKHGLSNRFNHQQSQIPLADQLFRNHNEATASADTPPTPVRDVPPLPKDVLNAVNIARYKQRAPLRLVGKSAQNPLPDKKEFGHILRIFRASPNLTITDFRRAVPQASQLEGWTLDKGYITKVVPGRRSKDLEQGTNYYLYFESATSAGHYREHLDKLSTLLETYAPKPPYYEQPPEGLVMDGINVRSAIAAMQALSGHQKIMIAPVERTQMNTDSFILNGGLLRLKNRPERMPFELRMRLEGKHIRPALLRSMLQKSGKDRGLDWSGKTDTPLVVTQWDEKEHDEVIERRYRPSDAVYIIGFETQEAQMAFLHHWHRRELGDKDDPSLMLDGDVSPIVNLDILW